jgi:hypothetical protein
MTWVDLANVAGVIVQARCNGTHVQMALTTADPSNPADTTEAAGFEVIDQAVQPLSMPSLNGQVSTALYQWITLDFSAHNSLGGRWVHVHAFAGYAPSCYALGTVTGA